MEYSLDLIVGPGWLILVIICCFSKFCILSLLRDRRAATVANVFRKWVVAVFGTPAAVRTDNGAEFKGEFAAYCAAAGIRCKRSCPYTSHSQGVVERLHRTVESMLRQCLVTGDISTLPRLTADIQLAINVTYARSIGCPPYLVMFGTPAPTAPALAALPDPTTVTVAKYATAVQHQLRTV